MNTPATPRLRSLLTVSGCGLLALPLSAQTAVEAPKGAEVVVMSPFAVQTDKDVGYEASRTLAGSRR